MTVGDDTMFDLRPPCDENGWPVKDNGSPLSCATYDQFSRPQVALDVGTKGAIHRTSWLSHAVLLIRTDELQLYHICGCDGNSQGHVIKVYSTNKTKTP